MSLKKELDDLIVNFVRRFIGAADHFSARLLIVEEELASLAFHIEEIRKVLEKQFGEMPKKKKVRNSLRLL